MYKAVLQLADIEMNLFLMESSQNTFYLNRLIKDFEHFTNAYSTKYWIPITIHRILKYHSPLPCNVMSSHTVDNFVLNERANIHDLC